MLNLNEVLDNKENGELERFLINTMPLFKGNGETTKTMMMITTYLKMHGKKIKEAANNHFQAMNSLNKVHRVPKVTTLFNGFRLMRGGRS